MKIFHRNVAWWKHPKATTRCPHKTNALPKGASITDLLRVNTSGLREVAIANRLAEINRMTTRFRGHSRPKVNSHLNATRAIGRSQIDRNQADTTNVHNPMKIDHLGGIRQAAKDNPTYQNGNLYLRANMAIDRSKADLTSAHKTAKADLLDNTRHAARASPSNRKGTPQPHAATAINLNKVAITSVRRANTTNVRRANTTNVRNTATIVRHAAINRTIQPVPTKPNHPTMTRTSMAVVVASTIRTKRAATHRALKVNVLHSVKEATRNVPHKDKAVRLRDAPRNAVTVRKKGPAEAAIQANVVTVRKREPEPEAAIRDSAVTVHRVVVPTSNPVGPLVNADLRAIAVTAKETINPAHRAAEADLPLVRRDQQPPTAKKSSKAKSPAIGLRQRKASRVALTKPSSA